MVKETTLSPAGERIARCLLYEKIERIPYGTLGKLQELGIDETRMRTAIRELENNYGALRLVPKNSFFRNRSYYEVYSEQLTQALQRKQTA